MNLVSRLAGGTLLGGVVGAVWGLVSSTWLGSPNGMWTTALTGGVVGLVLTVVEAKWGPLPGDGSSR